jgi:hypothetical protein
MDYFLFLKLSSIPPYELMMQRKGQHHPDIRQHHDETCLIRPERGVVRQEENSESNQKHDHWYDGSH